MIFKNDCYLTDRCKKAIRGDCNSEFCVKLFKLDKLYELSLLSKQQRKTKKLRLESNMIDKGAFNLLKSIESDIINFVQEGKNLYIHSLICGNGKTAWSIKLLQAYLDKIWVNSDICCRALFINVPRFLLTLKDNISDKSEYIEHIKANVLKADIVVWDEVATKDLTTFEHENLLNLINSRIDEGKANIYTSNLSPEDLKERLGDRLYSRIVNLSTNVELFGSDKRGVFKDDTVTGIK